MSMPVISALDFTRWYDERIPQDTPMRNFYRNKVVFLTGATGALGQIFIEKLIRCRVKRLYVLVRAKKDKSAEKRMQEICDSPLFVKCKEQSPRFVELIHIVHGDLQHLEAAISPADRLELIENVEIVVHAGADVRFAAPLLEVCRTNVRGTREILKLAKSMKRLLSFAYISTIFSHCWQHNIDETFYPAPIDPDEMIRVVEYLEHNDDQVLEAVTQRLTQPWPNNFTFSTALSEELVRLAGRTIPVTVIRPSMILSTLEDPITGYNTSTSGINGAMVAGAVGFMRVAHANADKHSHIVCSDFVVSATLASVWDLCCKRADRGVVEDDPKIYAVTINQDDLRWGAMNKQMAEHNKEAPLLMSFWVPMMHLMPCAYQAFFFSIFYEIIPHFLMDIFLSLTNHKIRLMQHYRFVEFGRSSIKHFLLNDWNLQCENIKELYKQMNQSDRAFFPCDLDAFYWKDYSYKYALGIKSYVLKENLNNVEDAKSKQLKLRIAHMVVLGVYYTGAAIAVYGILRLSGVIDMLKMACPYYNSEVK